MKFCIFLLLFNCFHFSAVFAQQKPAKFTAEMKLEMRDKIKAASTHAWQGYKQYAWGDDDLKPLTKKGKNWYKKPVLMTPVDAYDTFLMLGLDTEAAEAKEIILSRLNFDVDNDVQ